MSGLLKRLRDYRRGMINILDQKIGREKAVLKKYLITLDKEIRSMEKTDKNSYMDKGIAGFTSEGRLFSLGEMEETVNGGYEPVMLDSEFGHQIYEKSLVLLLATSVKSLYPHARVSIEHTIDTGLFCTIEDRSFPIIKMEHVDKIKNRMEELVNEDLPFRIVNNPDKSTVASLFRTEGYPEKFDVYNRLGCSSLCTLDEQVYDYGLFKTLPSTGYLKVFDLLYYPPGLILKMPLINDHTRLAPFRERTKLFRIHHEFKEWSEILDMDEASSLNSKIGDGRFREMILVSESLQDRNIMKIAEKIQAGGERARLILIAGPSSSGKTTFSKKLSVYLRSMGLDPVAIAMDDYFLPWDRTPRDQEGNMDFECVEAIDIELFNEHMIALLEGNTIQLPKYDFLNGKRETGDELKIRYNQPLIVEGIHGLNPELTRFIPDNLKFKIYVSALTQLNMDKYNRIKTTDVRLVRRIVRDAQFRGHSASDTIRMWGDVRAGEDKYIFPYQETADVMFNSSLPYELPVLKKFAVRFLEQVENNDEGFLKARQLLDILSLFDEIDPYYTPKTSILREFVGNSIFEY